MQFDFIEAIEGVDNWGECDGNWAHRSFELCGPITTAERDTAHGCSLLTDFNRQMPVTFSHRFW